MPVEGVAIIPKCEGDEAWLPADDERWRAYLDGDDFDLTPDAFFYCPRCAEREFDES
jgi:hypothetical protein